MFQSFRSTQGNNDKLDDLTKILLIFINFLLCLQNFNTTKLYLKGKKIERVRNRLIVFQKCIRQIYYVIFLLVQYISRSGNRKVIKIMKNISVKEPKKKNQNQNQQSTVSTQEDRVSASTLALISSSQLTIEMAVNYLFKWRKNPKVTSMLLERIQDFCLEKSVHFIPTIIFIMSLAHHEEFFKFCEMLAHKSLPLYLIVRWSYTTYWGEHKKTTQNIRNKLDSSLMNKFKFISPADEFDESLLKDRLKEKENYSNYLAVLNDYYERLFKIPQKLKKYQKPKRNQKLKAYLQKITETFLKDQNGYLNGVAFPIDEDSPVNVRVLLDYCFTFSTKQRVPFKLVFQTISYEDALKCKNGVSPPTDLKQEAEKNSQQKAGLILPSSYFGELWEQSQEKIKKQSPYSLLPSYKIRSFLIKSGDDLRQEYMATQLIKLIEEISIKENLKLWIHSYSVIPYNSDSGLIEFVPNTRTVSYLKQKSKQKSLRRIYQQLFGASYEESINNFIHSLAGYSLIQYLFQIKDRHNNNILIDTEGHIIHIDFSFMLSSSPGNMNFQRAPFKLTQDYIELMEGKDSDIFAHFRILFFLGLKYLRKYKKEIMETVAMMSHCEMKCFEKFDQQAMEKRFHENATDQELETIVDGIMNDAFSSYTTSNYDRYQWYTNFIYS